MYRITIYSDRDSETIDVESDSLQDAIGIARSIRDGSPMNTGHSVIIFNPNRVRKIEVCVMTTTNAAIAAQAAAYVATPATTV